MSRYLIWRVIGFSISSIGFVPGIDLGTRFDVLFPDALHLGAAAGQSLVPDKEGGFAHDLRWGLDSVAC